MNLHKFARVLSRESFQFGKKYRNGVHVCQESDIILCLAIKMKIRSHKSEPKKRKHKHELKSRDGIELPIEILELIFLKFTEYEDLFSCAQVNSHWRHATQDQRVWKVRNASLFNSNYWILSSDNFLCPRFKFSSTRIGFTILFIVDLRAHDLPPKLAKEQETF